MRLCVCVHESLVFVMKLGCEDEGCILEMVYEKLAPYHVTESYLARSQVLTWKRALRSLPGFSPIISLSDNEEERVVLNVRCVCCPSALAAAHME